MSKIRIGFDAVNIQDNQHLKNALINCDDPIKAISDFQEENSILLPTLKPALNLLDLHNVKRLDFHASIADELKDHLVKRIEDLASSINLNSKDQSIMNSEDIKKLEELLDKSFPLISVPRLTSLILLILKSLPKINENYLNYLNENEHLYSITPIEVKRQIWSISTDVFYREIKPCVDKFIAFFEEILSNFETATVLFNQLTSLNVSNVDSPVIKDSLLLLNTTYSSFFRINKRHMTYINEIVKLIGTSNKLYQYTLSTLYKEYLKDRNWFYSTLKSQLLVKLNELYNHEILHSIVTTGTGDNNGENLLKFSTIINICLKEKKIESKRAKELETIMESKKFEKIIPEVAFILADPFVIDMLARNAISFLNRCVQNELLPRNCTELIFLLRLLSLSLLAWEIMDAQSNKEPKMDAVLITEYLPNLAYFITDFCEKLYDDSLESLSNPTHSNPAPSLLATSPTIVGVSSTSSAAIVTTPTTPISSGLTNNLTKKSPPILLKISTRKLEIVSAIKTQVIENELCSVLLIYLVIACIEISDWINLKVLLPAIKYPNNNSFMFEKWFLYQFFNILNEKSVIEQFKYEWFVTLIFDEFLIPTVQQKDQCSANNSLSNLNSNLIYEQIYKLLDKIFPTYLPSISFGRLIVNLKPKQTHSSSIHIMYLDLKAKNLDNTSN